MIKDSHYYKQLDLIAVASQIPAERSARLCLEELWDVLNAIAERCRTEVVSSDRLRSLLGDPDRVYGREGGEVWCYSWLGQHGLNITNPSLHWS
jgi:hypothetical protein